MFARSTWKLQFCWLMKGNDIWLQQGRKLTYYFNLKWATIYIRSSEEVSRNKIFKHYAKFKQISTRRKLSLLMLSNLLLKLVGGFLVPWIPKRTQDAIKPHKTQDRVRCFFFFFLKKATASFWFIRKSYCILLFLSVHSKQSLFARIAGTMCCGARLQMRGFACRVGSNCVRGTFYQRRKP